MILDHLTNASLYPLTPLFQKAFRFLTMTDLKAIPAGRTTIDGDALFAITAEYETRPMAQGLWEAHRRYHDIQLIVTGSERIGFTTHGRVKVTTLYQEDVEFYEGAGDYALTEGMFAIFMPHDIHMPNLRPGEEPTHVRKVVVKVQVSAS